MSQAFPPTHLTEAQKLTADAIVDLFTITLVSGGIIYRFKDGETTTWQGNLYEGLPNQMPGDKRSSGNEEGRPILRVVNPEGVFNEVALTGQLDRATVVRKSVLRDHMLANVNIFQQRMWYVERVKELIPGKMLGLELRAMTDLPNIQVPVRMYIPPEFPTVSL